MNEKTMTTRLAAIALFVTCIAAHAQVPHVYEGYPVIDYYAQAPHMYEGFLHGHDYNRLRKNERIAFDMGVITGFFFAPAFGATEVSTRQLNICIKSISLNGAQLEAIVAKWMAAHPEDWGDVMHSTVYRAFGDACRAIGVEINDRQ
jgi:hypothetical protein